MTVRIFNQSARSVRGTDRVGSKAAALLLVSACSTGTIGALDGAEVGGGTEESDGTETSSGETGTESDGTGTDESGDGDTDGPRLDVGPPDLPEEDLCTPSTDEGIIPCLDEAPPDSFNPAEEWSWTGQGVGSGVMALVANLSDDNDDGMIDLCDGPDIVVVVADGQGGLSPTGTGHIHVFDGATGGLLTVFPTLVAATTTPAIGDIDGDGAVEIVTARVEGGEGRLVAFDHDGTVLWEDGPSWDRYYGSSVSLADLDADGDVEIIAGNVVADHNGEPEWTMSGDAVGLYLSVPSVDLDGDGELETLLGHTSYHADGSVFFDRSDELLTIEDLGEGSDWCAGAPAFCTTHAQVANLDGDDDPEIVVTSAFGLSLLEHDGTIVYKWRKPTGDLGFPELYDLPNLFLESNNWMRPAVISPGVDGDRVIAQSSANNYATYDADAALLWKAPVLDDSGIATGTAFDFLGDGIAESMYGDETHAWVFDGADGQEVFKIERSSRTFMEYPVVADVDDDGSAELVITSSEGTGGQPQTAPTVRVIGDTEDRWIQARRIWNQHAYFVTNVLEDGTIPQEQAPSWLQLNTFRVNSQIEGGASCIPPE